MNTKRRPSRIIYKYVEVPRQPVTTRVEISTPESPKESLAYRAWVNCYQTSATQSEVPPSAQSASAARNSSASSSRSGSTSSSHSSRSPTSSRGGATSLSPTRSSPPTAVKPLPPAPKTSAYSSPAILTKSSTEPLTSSPPHFSPPARSASRPVEKSYTTTSSTYQIKDGAVVERYKVVSSQSFQDGKSTFKWPVVKVPDWAYPLHEMAKGKKVLASYPHCQQR
ncbi:hypothetical protein SVAN01_06094 [Stagonosporopsis vannaccii]|nr:hypothetical protein SVAN01_06094 [Stagonosporopsis vannaccii]